MMNKLPLDSEYLQGSGKVESVRQAFGKKLTELARVDSRIVAMSADLASSVGLDSFRQNLKKRYVEVGIAEQNLVTVASGIASMGKIVFAASYAAFSPGRNWEQIRTSICLNDQPVAIVGSHAGLNVGADGGSHQMLEDIALMQVLPNMVVLAPADANEVQAMLPAIIKLAKPVYLRMPRCDILTVIGSRDDFEIGKAYLIHADDNPEVTIISTGSMVSNSLEAARQLSDRGIKSELLYVPTIKPLDINSILDSVERTRKVIVVEEHQTIGGLGSTVASQLLSSDLQVDKFQIIGVDDQFGQTGSLSELWHHYGLDVDSLIKKIAEFTGRN